MRAAGRLKDVVQEAFVSLWRSGSRYDPGRGSVCSWVLSTAHNRAVDAFRRGAIREGQNVTDEGLAEPLSARSANFERPRLRPSAAVPRSQALLFM
ncbi:MAG: sigma factor [Solirubrobacteraceae bacterium]